MAEKKYLEGKLPSEKIRKKNLTNYLYKRQLLEWNCRQFMRVSCTSVTGKLFP